MEHDGWQQRGQQQVGCVAITVILASFSLTWIWSISIPSGRGSKGLLSIRTSFLYQHRFTRSCESAVYHPCFSPSNPINSPLHQSRPRAINQFDPAQYASPEQYKLWSFSTC